jgi:hypothetical protein
MDEHESLFAILSDWTAFTSALDRYIKRRIFTHQLTYPVNSLRSGKYAAAKSIVDE